MRIVKKITISFRIEHFINQRNLVFLPLFSGFDLSIEKNLKNLFSKEATVQPRGLRVI